MKQISIIQSRKVIFGEGSLLQLPNGLKKSEIKNLLCIIASPVHETISDLLPEMEARDISVILNDPIQKEPLIQLYNI